MTGNVKPFILFKNLYLYSPKWKWIIHTILSIFINQPYLNAFGFDFVIYLSLIYFLNFLLRNWTNTFKLIFIFIFCTHWVLHFDFIQLYIYISFENFDYYCSLLSFFSWMFNRSGYYLELNLKLITEFFWSVKKQIFTFYFSSTLFYWK